MSWLERIEPTLGADEDTYRRHFLATDTAQAKGSAWLVLGLVAIVLALEIRSFAPELITVAPVLLALGGVLVLWLARDSEPIVLWPTAIVLVAANALRSRFSSITRGPEDS